MPSYQDIPDITKSPPRDFVISMFILYQKAISSAVISGYTWYNKKGPPGISLYQCSSYIKSPYQVPSYQDIPDITKKGPPGFCYINVHLISKAISSAVISGYTWYNKKGPPGISLYQCSSYIKSPYQVPSYQDIPDITKKGPPGFCYINVHLISKSHIKCSHIRIYLI